MQTVGFEQALTSRVDDMLDACTKCGACFTACPIAEPAGLGGADPKAVVSGVLDILRFGKGAPEKAAVRFATQHPGLGWMAMWLSRAQVEDLQTSFEFELVKIPEGR